MFRLLLASSIGLLTCSASVAQTFWQQSTGPFNGQVSCVAADSSGNLFAGATVGVYRSSDNGTTWSQVGLSNSQLWTLAVAPNGYIFAGTGNVNRAGVYRSTDDGRTWSLVAMPNSYVYALATGPSGEIFAGGAGVSRSTDGGLNWTTLNLSVAVQSLAITPSGAIFAGTWSGLYRSTDNGATWALVGLQNQKVTSLIVSRSGTIFASDGNVFRSIDNGNTWVQAGYLGGLYDLTFDNSGNILAGGAGGALYRSTDDGATWVSVGLNGISISSLVVTPLGTILTAGTNGIYRSTNGGSNWSLVNTSVSSPSVNSTSILSEGLTAIGTNIGIWLSSDNGLRWSQSTLWGGYTVYQIATGLYGTILAGGDNSYVYRSTDQGKNWQSINTQMPGSPVRVLVTSKSGYVFSCSGGGGVYRSTDQGNTWTQVGLSTSAVYSLASDSSGDLFAGTYRGVFISSDNGATWNPAGLASSSAYSLAIAPNGALLAGSDNGTVFKSTDYGVSWTQIAASLTSYPVQSLLANTAGTIYAGTNGGGVFQSTDNGSTWATLDSGLTNLNVQSLGLDSRAYLYAGTNGSWVFRSIDQTAPVLALSADSVSFGQIILGDSALVSVNATDSSTDTLTLSSVTTSGPGFRTNFTAPVTVLPSAGVNIPISFKPTGFGSFTDTLRIISNGGNRNIILKGSCPYPTITSNQLSLSYGDVPKAAGKLIAVTLINTSINKLAVDSVYTKTKWFKANVTSAVIADSGTINVTFTPDTISSFSDTLYVRNNSQTPLLAIPLSGISPPPLLSIGTSSVLFAKTAVGDTAKYSLELYDRSVNQLAISNAMTATSSFIPTISTPTTLSGLDSTSMPVYFRPTAFGTFTDTLTIQSNGGTGKVALSGSSPYPYLQTNKSSLSYGSVALGNPSVQTITVKDSSINALTADSIYTGTKEFTVSIGRGTVNNTDSLVVTVTFTPDSVRSYADTLYIHNNSQQSLVRMPLSGTCPAPKLALSSGSCEFGQVTLNDSSTASIELRNQSITSLSVNQIATQTQSFSVSQAVPVTIGGNDSIALQVEFRPVGFGRFTDTLTIQSNGGIGKVALSGISPYPTAILSKTASSFPSAVIGRIYRDSLLVKDTTINKLAIDSVFTKTRWFTAGLSKDTCGLNDSLFARITFTPDSARAYTDTLYLVNNSMTPLIKIPVSANVPAPVLNVPTTALSLLPVARTDSSSLDVTIHDPSINALTITALTTETNAFHVRTALPLTVQGKDSVKVQVLFVPTSFGSFLDTLTISSNGGNSKIPLSSSSPYPVAMLTHKILDYGMVPVGISQSLEVTVKDSSINALSIDSLYTKTKEYKVSLSRGTVKSLDSVQISVTFTPDTTGDFNDTLYIRNNSQMPLYRLPLSGSSPMPEIAITSVLSDFAAKAGQSGSQSVRFTNGSINVLVLDSAKTQTKYFKITTTFPDTVVKGDTASVQISFMPDSVRSYTDTLYVYSNAASPTVIALSGTGSTPTGILREGNAIPTVYELYQNYPNPFNPTTTIKFALPEQSQVTVTIYDILGREVKELVNDRLQAGYYHFSWNASMYASGVYFYRIVAQSLTADKKDFVKVNKLLFLK